MVGALFKVLVIFTWKMKRCKTDCGWDQTCNLHCGSYSQPHWLTDWLAGWPTDLLAEWLTVQLANDWLTDWLTEWLTGWPTDLLNGWLTDWLADWLANLLTALACMQSAECWLYCLGVDRVIHWLKDLELIVWLWSWVKPLKIIKYAHYEKP